MRRILMIVAVLAAASGYSVADEQSDAGKKVFLNEAMPSCAMCHTLANAGSAGAIGPNLDELKPEESRVIKAVTEGVGVMPAFSQSLSKEQIAAVAQYVAESTK